MAKVYIASPFFNDFEVAVRDLMVDKVLERLGPSTEVIRPDLTSRSESYDGSPSLELAKEIFSDNVSMIRGSDALVFPKFTRDLGTLFELGYALKLNKDIYSFNYLTHEVEMICIRPDIQVPELSILDMGKLSSAVVLGYNQGKELGYYLPSQVNDNIMLITHHHIKLDPNDNKLYEYDISIVNEKGTDGEKGKKKYTKIENSEFLKKNCTINKPIDLDCILGTGESLKKLYMGVS